MKKFILTITCILAAVLINAQSLEDIVKNYTVANKLDKIATKSTIKITAKMAMMGMDMPMEIWLKNPNKIKTVMNMGGQNMVQAFDGVKGYTINPMGGSTTPVEMGPEELKQIQRQNSFVNTVDNYLKNGQLSLEGEDVVNGKPVFKIKASIEPGTTSTLFIDKNTYLLAKNSVNTSQGGMPVTIDSFPTDYTETSGVLMPMKTTTSMSGMEMIMTITAVEVDIPMEDSVFTLK